MLKRPFRIASQPRVRPHIRLCGLLSGSVRPLASTATRRPRASACLPRPCLTLTQSSHCCADADFFPPRVAALSRGGRCRRILTKRSHPLTRLQAVKATREYGQLPCTRAAESPSWRNLTRVHAIDCVSWVQGSKCSLDGQCPFRHPPPVARVPCRHWIRNHGECWYAEHCNFLHPGSAALRTHDGRGQHGGDGGSGPAAIMSPPIPMTQRRPGPGSNPWGPSTSAIPMAATSLPSSPREIPGGGNTHRVIGSPWTSRAASSTARPPSPDVFGRPARRRDSGGVPDHVFGSALSSSISSVDDEIVNGSGMSRTNPTDTTPVPPHPTPRGRGTADEDEAIVPASVAAVWQRPRFESKQRLDFGLIPVGGSEDESATISALRLQLNAKDAEIARLTEALLGKDQQIAVLSTQLAEFHEQPSQ